MPKDVKALNLVLPFFDLKVQSGKAEREKTQINLVFYSLIRTFARN